MKEEGCHHHPAHIKGATGKPAPVNEHPFLSRELYKGGVALPHIQVGDFQVRIEARSIGPIENVRGLKEKNEE